jgi:hypothetical protein
MYLYWQSGVTLIELAGAKLIAAALSTIAIPSYRARTDQAGPRDNPYRYLRLAGKKGKFGNRKDRNENPLNADYNLYRMGKDGKTNQSLRPAVSHDDVIRARNGAYIGLAKDY